MTYMNNKHPYFRIPGSFTIKDKAFYNKHKRIKILLDRHEYNVSLHMNKKDKFFHYFYICYDNDTTFNITYMNKYLQKIFVKKPIYKPKYILSKYRYKLFYSIFQPNTNKIILYHQKILIQKKYLDLDYYPSCRFTGKMYLNLYNLIPYIEIKLNKEDFIKMKLLQL